MHRRLSQVEERFGRTEATDIRALPQRVPPPPPPRMAKRSASYRCFLQLDRWAGPVPLMLPYNRCWTLLQWSVLWLAFDCNSGRLSSVWPMLPTSNTLNAG